ncbi:MAG: hypothetical protein GX640_13875 [Fibrobacter sp.]|nr:hypothetical protein [Fibrobacter sp.]
MKKNECSTLFLAVVLFLFLYADQTFSQKPVFEKSMDASGLSETVINIEKWGRYSIEVQSPEGTALQLIDKKIGLREQSGIVGETNGYTPNLQSQFVQ